MFTIKNLILFTTTTALDTKATEIVNKIPYLNNLIFNAKYKSYRN